jgi:hypothetical protein
MAAVTQNPPLAAYYLAGVGSLFGWSEVALHIGFLLPALALVLGMYCLGRNFCSQPLWAALATVAAPVFLLSSTSVMCDTMMMAFWVWSVFFWMEGFKTGNPAKLGVAALLIAACSLTKYFGISLIPLLLTYSLLEQRRIGRWLAYLCLPVLALAFYQWLTHRLYGRGLLLNAVAYATHLRVGGELPSKLLAGVAFAGGGLVMLLTAAPLLWDRKKLAAGVITAVMVGLFVSTMDKVGAFPGHRRNQSGFSRGGGLVEAKDARVSAVGIMGCGNVCLCLCRELDCQRPQYFADAPGGFLVIDTPA